MPHPPNLAIDPRRLWDSLMETARFGATPAGGIRRLALSQEDRAVRDWLRAQCEALGCTVTVDACGTMVAHRPGRRTDLPPICMGSHLDTQPTGGKFDGCLGVLAGLEVLRTLHDLGYVTNAPLELFNWTNEEGSRFAPAMLASGVFAGAFTLEAALATTDAQGISFGDALKRIGYDGGGPVGGRSLAAMFELHIEQGPVLEAEHKTIGVVTGVQGMRWYDVSIEGQNAHTGATPMRLRRDALLGAARLVSAVNDLAARHGPDAVCSVGRMEIAPNSRNVVAGDVRVAVDLRHPDEAALDRIEQDFRASLDVVLAPLGLRYEERRLWSSPAVGFDPRLVACVRRGAARTGCATRDMVSGAGHDAAYVARVAPTTMIFVPCAGGVSHNEAEAASFEDCGAGAQVLLEAVLDFDASLA